MSRKTDRAKTAPKVLDKHTRERQLRHHLESLERDNFVALNEFEAIIATAAAAAAAPGPATLNPTKLGGVFPGMDAVGNLVGGIVGTVGSSGAGSGVAGSVVVPTSRNALKNKKPEGSGAAGAAATLVRKPILPKKPLNQLLDEQHSNPQGKEIDYVTANMGPSRYPDRQFCSVCGWKGKYRCSKCGMRYCDLRCLKTHEETR
ncbi:zinc finger HIT domain-containing protein 1 [Entomortierella parvispora]|uniref:Zinc finger HIT domain-containing protein 1 n=1 Tax=Entomortierella parvispora TaxID=205924 RepID=A0A9P3M1W4_9FUNG|nr:zinc finger HIT domain-containing protein 1 [Entomortierella parvispora]